jgi:hypothetical protein
MLKSVLWHFRHTMDTKYGWLIPALSPCKKRKIMKAKGFLKKPSAKEARHATF